MIRSSQLLAIGMALVGALAPSSFGQNSGRPPAETTEEPSTAAVSFVQTQPGQAARPAASTAAADKAVRDAIAAYVAAYNKKDAAKLAEFFTADGTLIDSDNVATRGREAIAQDFSEAFGEQSTYTLEANVDRIRLITPEVAQAEGLGRLVSPKEATIAKQFVALLARQGDAWKIAEIRDYPAPADSITPYERMKELDWMVGDWVDENDDVQVTSSVKWGQGKAYLLRDYTVQIKGEPGSSGLMIIAWDPLTDQIKSWIFNADGGRGEGSWTRAADNQWVVKAHGSTGDGRPTSATQVITLVNKDAVKTSSTDRVIGGEIARDIEDIIMVRKPPAPGAKLPSAKAGTGAPTTSAR
jgi:uncharacterized protein (TIGR02246 family)